MMQGIRWTLKDLPRRLLSRINLFLQKKNIQAMQSPVRNTAERSPAMFTKKMLQFVNRRLQRVNSKPKRSSLWGWTVGLSAVGIGLLVSYWEQLKWVSPVRHFSQQKEAAFKSLVTKMGELVDKQVLKNQTISSELEKLLYSICIASNVVHLTTESINKMLALDSLRTDASHLTNLLLVQKVFRELAEDGLKKVIVLVLRNEDNRGFLQHQILDFLGGQFFQNFVNQQFRELMVGQDFQQLLSDTATGTIRGNLKSAEFKQEVYRYIKERLM